MSYISLKDILISARQESHRLRHYFLGVEHIFIALLEVNDGITSNILEKYGFKPSYVIDAIRRKVGKGGKHRLWAGTPNTPRADIIMDIAHEIAIDSGRNVIHEQDLLIAILEENENIPSRVLRTLGLDTKALIHDVQMYEGQARSKTYFVNIDLNPNGGFVVDKDESYILRRMFNGYEKIYIDNKIQNSVTNSTLFFVTLTQATDASNTDVIVKVDDTYLILDEVHRYERYIENMQDTMVIEGVPAAPEASEYAGIQYNLSVDESSTLMSLSKAISKWEATQIADWIQQKLYNGYNRVFGKNSVPYQCEAWQEYAHLLPPLLEIDIVDKSQASDETPVIIGNQIHEHVVYTSGQMIGIKNCFVEKVDKANKCLHLAFDIESDRSHTNVIKLLNVDFRNNTHYRGEAIDVVYGTVRKTRDQSLTEAVVKLDPIFDTSQETIENHKFAIPNPIAAYRDLLNTTVDTNVSTIHGNLLLDTIVIDSNNNAHFIDFAKTDRGHRIYDWATLELSLLCNYILPTVHAQDWESIWQVLEYIEAVNTGTPYPKTDSPLDRVFIVMQTLRNIVQNHLANEEDWSEYFLAIALISLHLMTLKHMSTEGRRLMYLNSGLAIKALQEQESSAKPNPDNTSDVDPD